MELRDLRTFAAVARLLSFHGAARELHTAQSTVSARIAALESELGIRLFERQGRRVSLTEAGERLIRYAAKLLDVEEEARAWVTGGASLRGMLTVRVPETLCTHRLPPVIAAFRQRHPDVSMHLAPCLVTGLENDLRKGITDLAIVYADSVPGEDVSVEQLGTEPLIFVTAPHHPLAERILTGHPLTPPDLHGLTLLLGSADGDYRAAFDAMLAETGARPAATLEFASTAALCACAMTGQGVALLPESAGREGLESGRLQRLEWEGPPLRTRVLLVRHKGKWVLPCMDSFMELCRAAWSGYPKAACENAPHQSLDVACAAAPDDSAPATEPSVMDGQAQQNGRPGRAAQAEQYPQIEQFQQAEQAEQFQQAALAGQVAAPPCGAATGHQETAQDATPEAMLAPLSEGWPESEPEGTEDGSPDRPDAGQAEPALGSHEAWTVSEAALPPSAASREEGETGPEPVTAPEADTDSRTSAARVPDSAPPQRHGQTDEPSPDQLAGPPASPPAQQPSDQIVGLPVGLPSDQIVGLHGSPVPDQFASQSASPSASPSADQPGQQAHVPATPRPSSRSSGAPSLLALLDAAPADDVMPAAAQRAEDEPVTHEAAAQAASAPMPHEPATQHGADSAALPPQDNAPTEPADAPPPDGAPEPGEDNPAAPAPTVPPTLTVPLASPASADGATWLSLLPPKR